MAERDMTDNISQRFIFDTADVRGEFVQLNSTFTELLSNHHYPPTVTRLIGEFLAASALLSATIKFSGRLILQARSQGEIPLIMAECTSDKVVRGIVTGAEQALSDDFKRQLANGTLAITIEPDKGKRYQGIVPLDGDNLAQCLEHYFAQSEQLASRFFLAANEQCAAGLLLQQLPQQIEADQEDRENSWQHLSHLASTVKADELLQLPADELLHRLYHQDAVRLFETAEVRYECSCSYQRMEQALASLGEDEIRGIIKEQGEIEIGCEFCNQQYVFSEADVEGIIVAKP